MDSGTSGTAEARGEVVIERDLKFSAPFCCDWASAASDSDLRQNETDYGRLIARIWVCLPPSGEDTSVSGWSLFPFASRPPLVPKPFTFTCCTKKTFRA